MSKTTRRIIRKFHRHLEAYEEKKLGACGWPEPELEAAELRARMVVELEIELDRLAKAGGLP